ncbi:hypothetical protein [Vibrio fluvialis]|jgi:hypothetical protein|nr:hypothetical protein [Vibrio fluvialis]
MAVKPLDIGWLNARVQYLTEALMHYPYAPFFQFKQFAVQRFNGSKHI